MALNIDGTTGISGVDGSVSAPALTGTDSNTGITFPAADTIKFATGGVERMSITNSGVSGITAGITEADQWRLTTTLSNNGDNGITANWERNDTEFEKIGTGLSQSSGVYTFPSTGKYLIMYRGTGTGNGDRYIGIHFLISTNGGSSYTYRGESYGSAYNSGATTYTSFSYDIIVDVLDISNYKFYWKASSIGTCNFLGNSNAQINGFTAIKLGET